MPSTTIAYFSMEIALDPGMPTYSGGLGVLSGDTLLGAADLRVPMLAVTLVHRKGYFRQHLDGRGVQTESPWLWSPEDTLTATTPHVSVKIEERTVWVRAWRYTVRGQSGHELPVYLLDTDLPENGADDRRLTDQLYGGDRRYRLAQEVVLGVGGVELLNALGYRGITSYHMNEGHSALLTLALLEEQVGDRGLQAVTAGDWEAVRRRCVFTTHTPVAAGQDQFPMDLVRRVLGATRAEVLVTSECCLDGALNMTLLGLFGSRFVNGVAMRHGQVSRGMFPAYPINSITNGVHAVRWTSPPFQRLFDQHIPEWRYQNLNLRYAVGLPLSGIQQAHLEAKRALLAEVERRTGVALSADVMTLGFARRATLYKRADLLFTELDRLRAIAGRAGALQIVYAGKAHPRDDGGKAVIRRVFEAAAALGREVPVVYLEEYDIALARLFCAGADLWINTPKQPQEASGTSGMKAALNGVPSLSVLDGWWIEGHVEGVTGWSVGESWDTKPDPAAEVASLYDKLERIIVPLFYERHDAYAQVMRSAIALNGSFFNAQRMVTQYVENAYDPAFTGFQ